MPFSPRPARPFLVVAYLLLAAAGMAALWWPSPSVRMAGRGLADLWSTFLLVGGLLSACGAGRRQWLGEYIGLPLLIAVWAVYGLTSGYAAFISDQRSSRAGALALLGVAALLGYRWEYVAVYRKAARETAGRPRGELDAGGSVNGPA